MKQTYKHVAFAALMAATTLVASAQTMRTGYFSESYLYRHNMNPAMGNESNYIAIPVLGGINADLGMNVGVNNFVFTNPQGGKLVTFMHKSVDAGKFLGDLPDKIRLNEAYDMNLIDFGFKAWGGYNTFGLNFHEKVGVQLPKDLFAFMKEMGNNSYKFSDGRVRARGWIDLALGHSRNVNENLRVGGKVKFLFGAAMADANLTDAQATLGANGWDMKLVGDLSVAGASGTYAKQKTGKDAGKFDGVEYKAGLAGFGMGFDLGATYDMIDFVDGLKLSAAITDLGWINWKECAYAYNDGTPFHFDGFDNVAVSKGSENSLKNQWEDVKDDLENMYNLRAGASKSVTESLSATLTIGAEYELPMYKKVSFGALYTQRFGDVYGFAEGRLVCNYAPSHIFDLAVSGSVGTYGGSVGALANLKVTGFNLFLGTDMLYTGKVNSDMVPLEKGGVNVQFGINIPFGGKRN